MNNSKIKRTNVLHSKPEGDELKYGELFLNYNTKAPMLAFKTDNNNLRVVETGRIQLPDNFVDSSNGYVDDSTNLTAKGLTFLNKLWEEHIGNQLTEESETLLGEIYCTMTSFSGDGYLTQANCSLKKYTRFNYNEYALYFELSLPISYLASDGPIIESIRWNDSTGKLIEFTEEIIITSENCFNYITLANTAQDGLISSKQFLSLNNMIASYPVLSIDFESNTPTTEMWYKQNGTGSTQSFATVWASMDNKSIRLSALAGTSWNNIGFSNNEHLERVNALPITSNTNKNLKLFNNCYGLKYVDASNWDTCNVTTMESWFESCYSLNKLDLNHLDTRKVTNLNRTFQDTPLKELHINQWYMPNLQTMASTFQGTLLKGELDLSNWKVNSNLIAVSYPFHSCTGLTSIDMSTWSTDNLQVFEAVFYGCTNLETINLSGWNFKNITNWGFSFTNCPNLKNIIGPISGIKTDPGVNGCPLTKESALVILNGLADLSSGEHQTLRLHSSTLALLTGEELNIAVKKNWSVQS